MTIKLLYYNTQYCLKECVKNVASLVEPGGLETNVVHQYIESLSLQF